MFYSVANHKFMFVYMCASMCGVCTHLYAGVHAHSHVQKPGEGCGCSDNHSLPCFLEAGHPMETGAELAAIKPK